jgi:hypothetical protein
MAGEETTNTEAPGTGAPAEGAEPSITESIMQFDPFAPAKEKETPAAPKADGKQGAPPAGTPQPPAVKPVPGTAPPAAQPPAQQAKTPEQLIAEHTATIRQMLERGQQAPTATPAQPAKTEPEKPKFNLGVPEPILNAISSEDPKERSLAMHAIVNGVANAVWREAENLVRQNVADLVQGFPRIIESHMAARQTQNEVHSDFYGTYKQFNAPEFVPLVQATALQIINERNAAGQPVQGWSPEFRDEVANRLFAHFPMLKQPPAQPPAPKPRSFATGANGGARPAMEPGPVNDMLAILGKTQ